MDLEQGSGGGVKVPEPNIDMVSKRHPTHRKQFLVGAYAPGIFVVLLWVISLTVPDSVREMLLYVIGGLIVVGLIWSAYWLWLHRMRMKCPRCGQWLRERRDTGDEDVIAFQCRKCDMEWTAQV